MAATNDYLNNRFIGRLFFRLINESDKKKKFFIFHIFIPKYNIWTDRGNKRTKNRLLLECSVAIISNNKK